MDDTFSFLLQTARLINTNRATESDFNFVTELLLSFDDDLILKYKSTTSVSKIGNDYSFYLKLCNFLINYFEENEEYEKCEIIKQKIMKSETIT